MGRRPWRGGESEGKRALSYEVGSEKPSALAEQLDSRAEGRSRLIWQALLRAVRGARDMCGVARADDARRR